MNFHYFILKSYPHLNTKSNNGIKDIYSRYVSCLKKATEKCRIEENVDEVDAIINAIKEVDEIHSRDEKKCFAIAIVTSGDVILTRPCDYHCVVTCHEVGVDKCASIATGKVFYTSLPEICIIVFSNLNF